MSDKIKELVARLRMMRNMMDEQHIPLEKREAIKNRIVGAWLQHNYPSLHLLLKVTLVCTLPTSNWPMPMYSSGLSTSTSFVTWMKL